MRFRPAIRAAYLKGQQIAQITLEGDFNFSFACGGTCEQLTLPEAMGSQYGPHIFNVISVIVIAMSRGNRDTRSSIYIYMEANTIQSQTDTILSLCGSHAWQLYNLSLQF